MCKPQIVTGCVICLPSRNTLTAATSTKDSKMSFS